MKGYSGRFVLRVPSKLHRQVADIAQAHGLSLNQTCLELINKGLSIKSEGDELQAPLDKIVEVLKANFGDKLCGVVLFGSYANMTATAASDVDLLIVLDKTIPLVRSLYKWWDSGVTWQDNVQINPHFVHYPEDTTAVTGLWFEVAQSGKVLYQKAMMLDGIFSQLNNYIGEGRIRRHISNGHPYWVWRSNEE